MRDELVDATDRLALRARELALDGIVVQQHGRETLERHWTPDIRRDVFSVSKTVTVLAVGLAEFEGLLRRSDPVLRHLPDLAGSAAPDVDGVTVDSLLRMTSGLTWRWQDPDADHPGDPAADFLGNAPEAPPGELFRYRGGSTYVLGRIVEACSGTNLRDYLVPRLFAPLGIANPQWHRCPLGHPLAATGLFLRTGELARIAALLLDGGRWESGRIVPAEFVDDLTADPVLTDGHLATGSSAPHPENARYGRGVWLCARDEAWRMDGIHGQFGIVLPRFGACVTVTAAYSGPSTDILDAVWATVVPVLATARWG